MLRGLERSIRISRAVGSPGEAGGTARDLSRNGAISRHLDGPRGPVAPELRAIPSAGATHNINTGTVPLKLYTLYAPPNHRDGVVHHTPADAEADQEHFDGKTTEGR